MKRVMMLAAMSALSGCTATGQQTAQAPALTGTARIAAYSAESKSFADKTESAAKGTKSCHVKQRISAYLSARDSRPMSYSEIFVKVYKNGTAGIAVTEDTYPGTDAYFLIGGARTRADGDEYATLSPEMLAALKKEEIVKYTYTTWPYRNEVNKEDKLAGFETAYNDCLVFLRS